MAFLPDFGSYDYLSELRKAWRLLAGAALVQLGAGGASLLLWPEATATFDRGFMAFVSGMGLAVLASFAVGAAWHVLAAGPLDRDGQLTVWYLGAIAAVLQIMMVVSPSPM